MQNITDDLITISMNNSLIKQEFVDQWNSLYIETCKEQCIHAVDVTIVSHILYSMYGAWLLLMIGYYLVSYSDVIDRKNLQKLKYSYGLLVILYTGYLIYVLTRRLLF